MTPAVIDDTTLYAVLAPFAAAVVAPFLTRLLKHNAAWPLALVPALIFLHFVGFIEPVSRGETFVAAKAWAPSYGINFSVYVDGLSTLFGLLISGIGTFIILYAGGYLKGHPQQGRFFSFLFMFMGAMLGLVLGNNLISLFIFWELTSITSFLLIGFDHLRAASRRAAIQALVVTGGGGLALLAGFILIISATGEIEMSVLLGSPDIIKDSGLYLPIFLLVLGGAFTKSAQFPFHFWLPNAMEAPTPVSAYLHSATMVKAGVYMLMRMHPLLGDTVLWTTVLPLFGGVTLLVGTILAVRQTDLKLMLAYTTVASLGLLVMLTGTSHEKALEGAVLYLLAHSLFKGALFMVAGTIDHEAGTRDVTKLGGLRKAMPVTFVAACLAALSMAGLPPFIGFIAKEVLYYGTWGWLELGLPITITAVVGNSLMLVIAAAVAIKPFFGPKVETPKHAHEGPVLLFAGPVVLALTGLFLAFIAHTTGILFVGPTLSSLLGTFTEVDLHLWPTKINAPLILSVITIGLGIFLFTQLDRLREIIASILKAIGWGPDQGFDQFVSGIVRFATWLTRLLQTGKMQTYMLLTFFFTALAVLLPGYLTNSFPAMPKLPEYRFYEWGILLIAVLGLFAILVARTRLTAIVSLGVQGFAVALIFMMFGAPDLSFTQFMVETLSVVILALVMTRLNLSPRDHRTVPARLLAGVVAVAVGLGLGLTLLSITQQPFDSTLSVFFTEFSRSIAHGRNIVNVILVDFRGFDTLGEIAVVVLAGLCVLALIRVRTKPDTVLDPPPERTGQSQNAEAR
ncbi:MAG: putative monovalent cation/H+ antiporter subunit A [Roseibium album]|uniref:putative monovalent cation/H+ antiporter subunit A n=1 Tax=Roseibium album TaxID=311410 RepID=UPI000CF0F814|nr:putative monovalent cation/H+ antiporter subunit A [Roseibium album]MBG6142893.1 multicomponent Na+:H+ antiporter subunit A [Labrenzia sp. EL_142]MBG6158073.1 multicomponent Na+:H+ antiporter subunit A [Labrenzia sp. EL_162]MBG6165025.1 multicomponent Na+:H+ antiporter subunit A [Labrenzia sp. EL_195]MBG6196915.1 multicomponent Na+:H+ antiporter subunit A [Labrenzia sp. EL_159]